MDIHLRDASGSLLVLSSVFIGGRTAAGSTIGGRTACVSIIGGRTTAGSTMGGRIAVGSDDFVVTGISIFTLTRHRAFY
jgi:hypothetical protein